MSTCEECWDRAYMTARMLGGSQVDRYQEELAKHPEGHRPTELSPDHEDGYQRG